MDESFKFVQKFQSFKIPKDYKVFWIIHMIILLICGGGLTKIGNKIVFLSILHEYPLSHLTPGVEVRKS